MDLLDQAINQIYGNKLQKDNIQTQAKFYFQAYVNQSTGKTYYLNLAEFSINQHISEAQIQLTRNKYNDILLEIDFLQLQRKFQSNYFLLKSSQNIITLKQFFQAKRKCGETIKVEFMIKLIKFLINSYQKIANEGIQLFELAQVGFTKEERFYLYDPKIYFKVSICEQKSKTKPIPLMNWLSSFFKAILLKHIIIENQQQFNEDLTDLFEQNSSALRDLMKNIIRQKITKDCLLVSLNSIANLASDDITTVSSGSFVHINDISAQQPEKIQIKKNQIKKISRLHKIAFIIIIGALLGVGIFFGMQFFKKTIRCPQGQFLNSRNQCLSCTSGCLKCESGQDNHCMKCNSNMYLIVEDQNDHEGICLKQCSGKKMASNVCVRNKNITGSLRGKI